MSQNKTPKIIHVAKYLAPHLGTRYLFLRELSPHHLVWFTESESGEKETNVSASTIEEALRMGHRHWKELGFRTLICGFRYTLPERDEHGMNALFYQLAASQNSPNGIYFDPELGHNCYVQNGSKEAIALLKKLEKTHQL